jgi:ketosteroid isomerase-like protein
MSEENLETVGAHLVALNERDLDGFLATCTADVELWSLLSAVEGPYVGADGMRRFFADLGQTTSDYRNDVVRLEAVNDDRVLSVEHWTATGRSSGVSIDEGWTVATVFELSGGKIRRIRVFADPQEALEAAGLSE